MTTLEPPSNGGHPNHDQELTLFAEVFPASHSASLGGNTEPLTNDGDGLGWNQSYAQYDPESSSWKTSHHSYEMWKLSDGYSVTFTPSGSMRNGQLSPRAPWVPHTCDAGCSWWPTPTAAMGTHGWGLTQAGIGKRSSVAMAMRVLGVIESLGRWRPPVLMIEMLMGLPPGWLRPAEMQSSPRSQSSSDAE
jgi:hypothetical protein